ncbi:MAG TPA: MBL fold metallo-hydrolase [Cerasibacillus sp.]|uniref:MBL fold metallo-hydrolase n=1 Tax=Cerasibacillus sp. TaxID=2498711 RepID=UPI002F3FC37C
MKKKRFKNQDNIQVNNSWRDLLLWFKERMKKQKDMSFQVPLVDKPEITNLQTNRTEPTITWIGHCTFLIQLNGLNMITDPVWAKQLFTYKRLTQPGIPLADIPPIDVVLISHSHYDHLHQQTIYQLPGNPLFLVPAGLGKWFTKRGIEHVAEFSWWGSFRLKDLVFTFVPAQHWTKRTLFDTNTSHWGGWVIEGERVPSIYFVGDSGYFRGFAEIGERFKLDYALMPIGAYEPEWFMHRQHVSPEEAVQAFLDTRATYMIPTHYGAFMLADDTPEEALNRLFNEWERRNINKDKLYIPKLGQTLSLKASSLT